MNMFLSFILFYLIPLSFYKFVMNFNHLLISLFTLEFISLSLFLCLLINLHVYNLEISFMMFFLIMVVCEGVLGLCMLVNSTYNFSSDYIFSFNNMSC